MQPGYLAVVWNYCAWYYWFYISAEIIVEVISKQRNYFRHSFYSSEIIVEIICSHIIAAERLLLTFILQQSIEIYIAGRRLYWWFINIQQWDYIMELWHLFYFTAFYKKINISVIVISSSGISVLKKIISIFLEAIDPTKYYIKWKVRVRKSVLFISDPVDHLIRSYVAGWAKPVCQIVT